MAGCNKLRGKNNPKMKTVRAAAKRFTLTGTGKFKFKRKGLRHNLSNKNRKRKRLLRQTGYLCGSDVKLLRRSIIA